MASAPNSQVLTPTVEASTQGQIDTLPAAVSPQVSGESNSGNGNESVTVSQPPFSGASGQRTVPHQAKKRKSTTNWENEEGIDEPPEEKGQFEEASEEALKNRDIRTAIRSNGTCVRNPEKLTISTNPFRAINLCPRLGPISSDYEAQGTEFTLGENLKIYETKDKSSKVVLICAYDISGYHPNTKQFCDKLNSSGVFRVAMPDFFRSQPFRLDAFPPTPSEIKDFVSTKGSWEKVVKNDLQNVIDHYKKEGATAFGIFGFCLGGKRSIQAVAELDDIKAAALIHPALLEISDAEAVKSPVLFLPSKDEPDLIPLYEIVKKNLGEENTGHHRFEDMFHGFAGARGDWKDELQKKRADEAISLVYNFMKKHLIKQLEN